MADSEEMSIKDEFSKAGTGKVNNSIQLYIAGVLVGFFLYLFKYPRGDFMSAPWDGGWEGLVHVGPETTNMIFFF